MNGARMRVGLMLVMVSALAAACSGTPTPPEPSASPSAPAPATTMPNPYADTPQAELDSSLLESATSGRAAEVDDLLQAGADTETRDAKKRTPLLLAVTGDHVAAARLLVTAGADVDALDDQSDTPWLVTGVTGSVEMAQVLLPADPDLTIRNRYGGISHIPASERGHADYVNFVLDHTDIEVDHVNDLAWTALLEAVILGEGTEQWQRIVQSLIDHGADVSIADRDGVTPLQHARNRGFTEIAAIIENS